MPRVLAVGSWNLNRGAGCGDAESSSNRTESDLVPESDSGSMNRDRGTAYRSPFPATMGVLWVTLLKVKEEERKDVFHVKVK